LPLLKRARIEIYLPGGQKALHKRLQHAFEDEFLHTFGGCTVIGDIKGLYLTSNNKPDFDRINLVYADTPFDFVKNFDALSRYTDQLKEAALEATDEESILIVVHEIYHSVSDTN
jgi:hypothetical protein